MPRYRLVQIGVFSSAAVSSMGAAITKTATRRNVLQVGYHARNVLQLLFVLLYLRHGCNQTRGIGMQRHVENVVCLGVLYNLAEIHHIYIIAQLRYNTEIVGDHQNRSVKLILQIPHQV